ncbi:MAG TPA: TIGR03560 family F420-dependent LLM class oxidoreductase [Dehalococcoidia bacterium]|nr:TIGR03560 family F420-dependent LLM class oxidoreductase [Dehalococcoidia bacterium]
MKLCLSIEVQEGLSYEETLALARASEAAGFDAALLADHYYPTAGPIDRPAADAWIYLGALARETERIRLGTLVSPVTFRHPAVLAKLAATLDRVSGGRAELGVGAGWLEAEHTAYGFDFPPGPDRVSLLEEQLQVIKGLWTADSFTHAGPRYRLSGCHFTPAGIRRPHPPLLVGGRPPARRIPRLAARYADEYSTTRATPDQCREVRSRLDHACEAIGRDPATLSFSILTGLCVGESDAEVKQRLAALGQAGPDALRGLEAWITGTPREAADRVRRLAAAGVDRLMLSVEGDLHREMIPLLGERVLPLLA